MTRDAPGEPRLRQPFPVTLSIVAGVAGLFALLAWYLVDPAPPKTIALATGSEGGFYQKLGDRYRWALSRYGVEVELVPTLGSPENLALLNDGSVDAAFMQGGVGTGPADDTQLRTLATLAIEPLWLFSRTDHVLTDLLAHDNLRIAAGVEGSGTRDLVARLVRFIGIADQAELLPLSGEAAVDALFEGEVDVVAAVTAPTTRWVAALLSDPDVNLVETRNLAALASRLPFVKSIELPARIINYRENVPPVSKTLFGVSTALLVQNDLHPAIKQLMLQVSSQASRGSRLLGTYDQFPSRQYAEYPLDPEAERFFTHGPTLLRRYLPFWAANLFERFWVLAIPIVTLLIPLIRFGPMTVEWSIRRRIFRHYRELREIEIAGTEGDETVRAMALADLDRMEESIKDVAVPLGFRDDLYRLRTHVVFIRDKLHELDRNAQEVRPSDTGSAARASTRVAKDA